jgi:hypothetical protein
MAEALEAAGPSDNRPLDGLHLLLRHGPQYRAGESHRAQEYHPLSINGLTLPTLRVAA